MLIAARNAVLHGGWKNPYVTDGLIAMWDGIDNVGQGIHDPNAAIWKDLVGGLTYVLPAGAVFDSNRCVFANTPAAAFSIGNQLSGNFTLDALVKFNSSSATDTKILATEQGNNSLFITYSSNGIVQMVARAGSDAGYLIPRAKENDAFLATFVRGNDMRIYYNDARVGGIGSTKAAVWTTLKFPYISTI